MEKKNFEMEVSNGGKPICFLVWELDMIKQKCSLVVVLSDRSLSERYSKYIRRSAEHMDRQVRVHIEEREMNHLFGFSIVDNIGLPLKDQKFLRNQD